MQVATCASPMSVNEDVSVSASWTELLSSCFLPGSELSHQPWKIAPCPIISQTLTGTLHLTRRFLPLLSSLLRSLFEALGCLLKAL